MIHGEYLAGPMVGSGTVAWLIAVVKGFFDRLMRPPSERSMIVACR
jgi:hypothetical protein